MGQLIWGKSVVFRRHEGSVNIYGYDLNKQSEYPLVLNSNNKFPTGLFGSKLVYEENFGGIRSSDVRLLNIKSGKDMLIAGGEGAQGSAAIRGDNVVFIDGGACGKIFVYRIGSQEIEKISEAGCAPLSIWGNNVVWANRAPGGTNIYGYHLARKESFVAVDDLGVQEQPDIHGKFVAYLEYGLDSFQRIYVKNLDTGKKRLVREVIGSSIGSPSLSNGFVVWRESPVVHTMGIKAMNLKSGEIFEIQEVGNHQNTNTAIDVWNNTVVWQAWRSGNGDIYGATLK